MQGGGTTSPLPPEGIGGPTYRVMRPLNSAELPTSSERWGWLSVWEVLRGKLLLCTACLCLSCVWTILLLGLEKSGLEGPSPWDQVALPPLDYGLAPQPACDTCSPQGHQFQPHSQR